MKCAIKMHINNGIRIIINIKKDWNGRDLVKYCKTAKVEDIVDNLNMYLKVGKFFRYLFTVYKLENQMNFKLIPGI